MGETGGRKPRLLVPITERELVAILRAGIRLHAAFGTGWVALIWEEGEPMPAAVGYLARLRGVSNENMEGAGI